MDLGDFLNSFGAASPAQNQQPQKEMIETIITEFIENEKDDKGVNAKCITKLLIAFQMKQTQLLDFFFKLKFYFLNGREVTRQRSAHLVYLLFQRYSGLVLCVQEISSLFDFFLAKLHDFATACYAHKIIHQLLLRVLRNEAALAKELKNTSSEPIISLEQWKQGMISQFIQQIGDPKLSPSSYSQEVRDAIFTNVIFLQEHFKNECCKLGQESVKIFIDITEDEKDPRCIVKVFKIIKHLLDAFSAEIIEPFAEEIFTNLECYYPIDFHPDPEQNKKYQISTKDLSDALDDCLISPHLKARTFTLLQEKMSSSFIDAKLAGLQTYSTILKNYLPYQLTTAERKGMLDDILENAQDIEETELTEAVVISIKDFVVFLTKSTKHTETINEEHYCDIKRIEKHAFKLLEDGLLHLNALLAEKILTSLVPISDSLEALITNSIVKYFNSKFSAKDSATASKQLELLLIILLAAEKQIEASSHVEKRRYFIDEMRQSHLKGILMGEIQSDRDEQTKILAVAILSKLAAHGQTPGEQDIAFMRIAEDIGLSEMDIEGYSSTLKKCLVEYCFLVDSHLAESETELLRLRLGGLLGQNNMAEHVTSAFGAMVLSGSENWKKCVEFAAQNVFQKEVRTTLESLIQKMLTLQTKYPKISVFFVEVFLQQAEHKDIEKSKFISQVKEVIGGAVSRKNGVTGCSESCICCTDDTYASEQSKKILETTDLTQLIMFTKYLKRMPGKTDLSRIFTQYLADLLSFKLHPFMTSMALFFGNKAHLYLTSEQFQQVIVFLTQQLTQQNAILALSVQNLKLLSKILRGLLVAMNEQAFKLLKDIIQFELSEQHTLPLSFYTDVLGSDNYSEEHKSYLDVTPTQPQRIFLTFLHPFHNKILNLSINNQLKNRCYHVLISVLLSSPFALVTSQKEICLPILVQALTFASDTSAVESAINLLSKLINLDLDIIGSRAESLLNCLLKLLSTSQLSVSCLTQLLKCLAECTRFSLPLVKRYKNEVLDAIESCLSHKKRIVRRHAIFAVNRWHQII